MNPWREPEPFGWQTSVEGALAEDIGSGDLTALCVPADDHSSWFIEAQADGVACGVGIAQYVLNSRQAPTEQASLTIHVADGEPVQRGTVVLSGKGASRRLLTLERTALNYLMVLSGVAELTAQFVRLTEGCRAQIIDTRKTVPGLRLLQKYAVRCGGGANHRMGLFDGVLIKDNHILACGGVRAAIERVRPFTGHLQRIEVECTTLSMVEEAVEAGAGVILLDNMSPEDIRTVVREFEGRVLFEASGGVTLQTVRAIADTGVHYISVGAITHSAVSVPYHLEFE